MPLVEAKCTNCGANLKVDNTKDAAICEFCGTPFVVEKAINNYNVSNNISNSIVNIYGGNSADFIIRAGKLEKYIGASSDVIIPNSVTIIGNESFAGCTGLTSVIIPNSVVEIGDHAFSNCKKIKSITFPESVVKIGKFSFENCESLLEIKLNNKLKEIPCYAFRNTGINELIIPRNIKSIDIGAFACCKNLERIVFPTDLIKLCNHTDGSGVGPFYCCYNLSEIENGDRYDSKFWAYSKVKITSDYQQPVQTSSNNGCYIATSVYGSYDCPQVWILRRFRDYYLAKTWYGKVFIKAYYSISPTLVKLFGNTKLFKSFWKKNLDRFILNLELDGYENTPYNDIF